MAIKQNNIEMFGNLGVYLEDGNAITFQIGSATTLAPSINATPSGGFFTPRFTKIDKYHVATRGRDNKSCENIENDIKRNRLLPRLIDKQAKLLYGKGLATYTEQIQDGKLQRTWEHVPEVTQWLESWEDAGMEMKANELALALIKRYYRFYDFFVKQRYTKGKAIGSTPIAGLELVENTHCRLGTTKENANLDTVTYNDFEYVIFGNWNRGASKFKTYPLFKLTDVEKYNKPTISHHRASSVDDFYGLNETHEGIKTFLKTSNELPTYIDSFLENSLAAKIHVIIPHSWMDSKRMQIKGICDENRQRQKDGKALITYNDIAVGVDFKESYVIKFMNAEMRKLSEYLSGSKNQGKAYATFSYRTGHGSEEERWKIEPIDLKYKEYITSLIEYDKRVDEVLISAVGIDSSISAVSKPGMISKSGSDAYYNLMIYLISLTPDDEICAAPFNTALRLNFPDHYKRGLRFGFYREIPSKQEEVSPKDRLNQQTT